MKRLVVAVLMMAAVTAGAQEVDLLDPMARLSVDVPLTVQAVRVTPDDVVELIRDAKTPEQGAKILQLHVMAQGAAVSTDVLATREERGYWARNWGWWAGGGGAALIGYLIYENNQDDGGTTIINNFVAGRDVNNGDGNTTGDGSGTESPDDPDDEDDDEE